MTGLPGRILLPPAAMAAADRLTIAAGTPGIVLMERAGAGIVRAITAGWAPRPVLVLCGPGNNGGDGWVVARRLRAAGWPVRLASSVPRAALGGDAALAAARWQGAIEPLDHTLPIRGELIVDAIYGAGLNRPIDGPIAALLERLPALAGPVVAVDVPSGVDGATGATLGPVVQADLTVTFAAAKPGHFLLPGRDLCGRLLVHDIGITPATIERCDVGMRHDTPELWAAAIKPRTSRSHKYEHGHALVIGGPIASTGAARLAATAALRIGAGLVSVAAAPSAVSVYAASLTAVMSKPVADAGELATLLADRRITACLIGPGAGLGAETKERVVAILETGKPVVLDADALSAFAEDRAALLSRLHARCVLTPHEGEFGRLFERAGTRIECARRAAEETGATLILKGGDTIVAASGGRIAIADHPPPSLATAGSGDVLAGIVLGLLAQGMEPFLAAAAGVWMHGEAAHRAGPNLTAEDLERHLVRSP